MADTEVTRALLGDAFERIHEGVPAVVAGLSVEQLLWRPDADANHIGWLVWHLARQQDEQMAHLAGVDSAWASDGWAARMGLPYPARAHGYGMTSEQVGAFRVEDPAQLVAYHEATHQLSLRALDGFSTGDYTRVIDKRWDPPVTVSARIVSVLDDAAKHLGQAEYVRGLVQRRS